MFRSLVRSLTLSSAPRPLVQTHARNGSYRAIRKRQNSHKEEVTKAPLLSHSLRKFYMLTHPDLMHSHPTEKAVNEASLQTFNEFLSSIKSASADKWPPAQGLRLDFYLKPGAKVPGVADHVEGDALHKVTLKLRTNGGICKGMVEETMSNFFQTLGITNRFRWDRAYWPIKAVETRKEQEPEEETA